MTKYLQKSYDWQTAPVVAAFDEISIWSSVPGNLLLNNLPYGKHKTIVDIGFGTGFPLLTLARRFGESCQVIGVDIWEAAIQKTKQKAIITDIENMKILQNNAIKIDIPDNSIDLITSNLGINNFENPVAVIQECQRILKPNGSLFLTSNLVGTFQVFYDIFEQVLNNFKDTKALEKLKSHISHRATINGTIELFEKENFKISKIIEQQYSMFYADGTAFLNDYFIVMAFMPSWKNIIEPENHQKYFEAIENELNKNAENNGNLELIVPIMLMEFV